MMMIFYNGENGDKEDKSTIYVICFENNCHRKRFFWLEVGDKYYIRRKEHSEGPPNNIFLILTASPNMAYRRRNSAPAKGETFLRLQDLKFGFLKNI